MTQHAHLDPSPFHLEGGATGILLIHGFTSSPPEMRLVGDYLLQRGPTVSAPLLPGHGTSLEQLNRCRWTDWTQHVEGALDGLRSRCEAVFVGGFSMGAVLANYLVAHHGLQGAVLYSPAVKVTNKLIGLAPVLKYLVPKKSKSGKTDLTDPQAALRKWSYGAYPVFAAHELFKLIRRTRRLLPELTCPLVVIHSTGDQVIAADSAEYTYEHAGSLDKELVTLHNSGHAITADSEWETVAEKTYSFVQAHLQPND